MRQYRYNIQTGLTKIKTKTALTISAITLGAAGLGMAIAIPALTHADSSNINFENPPYIVGDINGQDGWSKTGSYDAAVVTNTYGYSSFGSQTLRISDAITSGSFGDQTFSKPLVNEAGEADAVSNGFSSGTRQPHFEAQFDLASTLTILQPGMHVSVSPDRGDGARMSYLRFEDQADGIHVFFDDVTNPTHTVDAGIFSDTDIATISRSPHSIKFSMDFYDGPDNDVVKIYIDGMLKKTGTSWEDYYRFDTESQGTPHDVTLENKSRTVDSLLFREGGAAQPTDSTKGFLVDNLSSISGPITNTSFQVKPWTYDPGKTRKVSSAWIPHTGLADAGGSDHGLYLTKMATTATNASSGATVTYAGALNSLGFDYKDNGHCGAGAPRFNVYTSSGVYYFLGCSYGVHTPVPGNPGWTRVTFTNADAFPSDGTTPFLGFGSATITGIDIVFDEGNDLGQQGFAYLDNIQVNGVYAGKPGLAQ